VNWRNIGVVYQKELTDSLRDRRTVISMVVVPIVLMPMLTILLGVVSARLIGRAMREVPAVMVLGGQDSPGVRAALGELSEITIVPPRSDYAQEITDKRIRAAVEIPRDFDALLERGETAAIHIYVYQGDLNSGFTANKLEHFFGELRDRIVRERLAARHLPASLVEPVRIDQENVAPPEKVGGVILGGLIPYFVIILSLTGTMYPAMDLTVGEKERGTIETLLCSPASRLSLVLGKFFMVLTASLATAVLSIASMGLTLAVGERMLGRAREISGPAFQLTLSFKALVWVFVMVVPLAVLFSAALLAISLFARSFKEAQSYLSPLTIVVLVPAIVSLLPGVELNARLSLIPILNTSLVSKEIVSGTYHWNYIAMIFLSSCAYAAVALAIAIKLFQREDVLLRV
jgi:sodium transport system permease protein